MPETTKENKVRFNLKNVHYAVIGSGGTYGTPVDVKGAVSLDLSAEGEMSKFYADGIAYYVTNSNQGYSGSLEMAMFPAQMLKDIWGYTEGTTSKVLTENANVEPKQFALMYQIDGDQNSDYFVLYACSATRPNIGSQTNEETKEVRTQTCDITAVPLSDGKVFARTTKDTPTATKEGWFTTVFQET